MKRIMLYILMIVILGGCTYAAIPIKNETLVKIDKIGIVSIVGNEFTYGYMGITVFNNEVKLENQNFIDFDYQVQRILEESINTKLTNNPKPIKIVNVDFDREKLINSYREEGKYKVFKKRS